MIFFLIFLFFIILLEVLILGLIFSYITIDIENIELKSNYGKIHFDEWNVSLILCLYRIIPVLKIKIDREYCIIFGRKIYYKDKFKYRTNNEFYKSVFEFFKENKIKKINPQVEKVHLYLNFGTEDMLITTFLTVIISNLLVITLKKIIKDFDNEKHKFKVEPNYFNVNNFKIKLSIKFNFKTLNLINQ